MDRFERSIFWVIAAAIVSGFVLMFISAHPVHARNHSHEIHVLHDNVRNARGTLEENARRATDPEKAACLPDAIRLCNAKRDSDVMVIGMCMMAHRKSLGKPCAAVFQAHGF